MRLFVSVLVISIALAACVGASQTVVVTATTQATSAATVTPDPLAREQAIIAKWNDALQVAAEKASEAEDNPLVDLDEQMATLKTIQSEAEALEDPSRCWGNIATAIEIGIDGYRKWAYNGDKDYAEYRFDAMRDTLKSYGLCIESLNSEE